MAITVCNMEMCYKIKQSQLLLWYFRTNHKVMCTSHWRMSHIKYIHFSNYILASGVLGQLQSINISLATVPRNDRTCYCNSFQLLIYLLAEFGTFIIFLCLSYAKWGIILLCIGDYNLPWYILTTPDIPNLNVDARFSPQSALDVEDVPPPIPPKQLSKDDVVLLCKVPKGIQLQESGGAVPPICAPKANQEETTIPPCPSRLNQIKVSG